MSVIAQTTTVPGSRARPASSLRRTTIAVGHRALAADAQVALTF